MKQVLHPAPPCHRCSGRRTIYSDVEAHCGQHHTHNSGKETIIPPPGFCLMRLPPIRLPPTASAPTGQDRSGRVVYVLPMQREGKQTTRPFSGPPKSGASEDILPLPALRRPVATAAQPNRASRAMLATTRQMATLTEIMKCRQCQGRLIRPRPVTTDACPVGGGSQRGLQHVMMALHTIIGRVVAMHEHDRDRHRVADARPTPPCHAAPEAKNRGQYPDREPLLHGASHWLRRTP